MSAIQQIYVVSGPNQGAVGLRTVLSNDKVWIGGKETTATRTVSGSDYRYSYAPSDGTDTIYRDNLAPGEAYILKSDALAFSSAWPQTADQNFEATYTPVDGTETPRKYTTITGGTVTTSSY